ncbi:MAG TPA: HlyD family efflux transporter periplasmic adaptor subunit [Phycisphaerales bacterium]|nr:HlyD family efflux transporter periplasmic adaptor subunit [Phycisphaerales bacterium]HMP36038.1 HlyD family efflux transporter periplasmic adaptor subunit [Phycisphaerales bacterium]
MPASPLSTLFPQSSATTGSSLIAARSAVAGQPSSARSRGRRRDAVRDAVRGAGPRRGKAAVALLVGLVVVGGLGALGWLALDSGRSRSAGSAARDVHTVARGDFRIVVPSSGELEARSSIKVANKLESRAVLTWIKPEGEMVSKGDLLFTLADEEIRNRIKDADDAFKSAEANLVAAQTGLSVRESAAASEYSRAELAVKLAELALEAWEKAEEQARRDNLRSALETAQINYERLVKKYEESQGLVADEHISLDECERDRIAMIEARARFQTARLDLDVYEQYTFLQDKAKRESDVDQARAELGRVQQRNDAEIGNAKATLASAEHRLTSARERLEDLQRQLGHCAVTAPSSGLVVYATSLESGRWGGGGERTLQVGTELRPNEDVIILPDTTQMVAAVKVSEALVGRVRRGQRATIIPDARPNDVIEGTVVNIGVLAEQGGWRDPNRRDYTVRIELADMDPRLNLKPSMRCRAEIVIEEVADVLHVPIQAVFRDGRSTFVYVSEGAGVARRQVVADRASELKIEIVDGLREGERVLLRAPDASELGRQPTQVASAATQAPARPGELGGAEPTGADRATAEGGGAAEGAQPRRGGDGPRPGNGRPRGGQQGRDVAATAPQPTS